MNVMIGGSVIKNWRSKESKNQKHRYAHFKGHSLNRMALVNKYGANNPPDHHGYFQCFAHAPMFHQQYPLFFHDQNLIP